MGSLEIRPVHSTGDLRRFIRLPFRLYRDEPHWVAPLLFERKQFLDRRKNPFFRHGRAEYFLALRDGRPVGRITAQVDDNFQRFQDNRWGWFGFFECERDPEVAGALLDRAEQWLRGQGCDRMVGPADFTTNDECGVLLEGHERTPLILSPWTHRYYPGLLDGAGMAKAMDLLMWELHISGRDQVNPVIWKLADQVEERHGIVVRPFRKKDIETVGAALTLPDYNQALLHMRGRILPFGWAKFLRHRGSIDRVRVFALGVKPEWQHTGVAAKFYERHFDAAARTPQTHGEMGWILEVNKNMNKAMEAMGGKVVRRFRLYEREFAETMS